MPRTNWSCPKVSRISPETVSIPMVASDRPTNSETAVFRGSLPPMPMKAQKARR